MEDHAEQVSQVLQILNKWNLRINRTKCFLVTPLSTYWVIWFPGAPKNLTQPRNAQLWSGLLHELVKTLNDFWDLPTIYASTSDSPTMLTWQRPWKLTAKSRSYLGPCNFTNLSAV